MGWRMFSSVTLLICWVLNTLPWTALCQGDSSSSPEVSVTFLQVPSSLSNVNNAKFVYKVAGGKGETGRRDCPVCCMNCVLDGEIIDQCGEEITSFQSLQDGDHTFEVCAKASQGRMGCATHNWTIDTVAPTAHVTTSASFTSAHNVTAYISFSEPCSSGFQCSSVNTCNLLVSGAGEIIPQSLSTIIPKQKYSILISLSSKVEYGSVMLAMEDEAFCTDAAGNKFTKTEKSSSVVKFDRRSVNVSMRVKVPEKQIEIDGQTRTVQATNNMNDLKVYLDFSRPVLNMSTVQKFLNVSNASLRPIPEESDGNRSFEFLIVNVSSSEVVTVQLDSSMIVARQGIPVSPVPPAVFIVDSTRPNVGLSTTADLMITKDSNFQANIDFTKPVFGLNYTHINISGGHVTSFKKGNDKKSYVINIQATGDNDVLHINIPENVTADAAGNGNLPSNLLQVRHYPPSTMPATAAACVTGSFLVTSFGAGLLTVSSSTLQSAGAVSGSSLASEPTRNLFRTASYIQVFALSRMVGTTPPAEYYEFTANLKWSIPYLNLPWEKGNKKSSSVSTKRIGLQRGEVHLARGVNGAPSLPTSKLASLIQGPNQKPKSGYVPSPQESNGWIDFERCMFWIAIIGGGLTLLHSFLLLLLKLRNGFNQRRRGAGALVFPRFEMFLLILSLPSICKASASIIKGGTGPGKAVGSLLLALASLLQMSVFVFLSIGVTCGKLLEYKEDRRRQVNQKLPWYQEVTRVTLGPGENGQWTWKGREEGTMTSIPNVDSSDENLAIFGPLFEDLRGPPNNYTLSSIKGGNSKNNKAPPLKQGGDGRIVASGDGAVDADAPLSQKLFGNLGVYYLQIESLKRFILGVLAGLYSHGTRTRVPTIILLCITSFQLFLIALKKPFIRKKVQLVEIISIACQVGNFMAMLILQDHGYKSRRAEKKVSIVMLVLFFVGFSPMMINEWFGLNKQVRRLGGTKIAARGLLMFVFPDSTGLSENKDDDDGAKESREDGNAAMPPDERERQTKSEGMYSSKTDRGPPPGQRRKMTSAGLAERNTAMEDDGADDGDDGGEEELGDDNDTMPRDGRRERQPGSNLVEESTMHNVAGDEDDGAYEEPSKFDTETMPIDGREGQTKSEGMHSSNTERGPRTRRRRRKMTSAGLAEGDDDGGEEEEPAGEDHNDTMPRDGTRESQVNSESRHFSKTPGRGMTRRPGKMASSSLAEEGSTMHNVVAEDEDDGAYEEPSEFDGETMPLNGRRERQKASQTKHSPWEIGEEGLTMQPSKLERFNIVKESAMNIVGGDEYDGAEEETRENDNHPTMPPSDARGKPRIDRGPTRQPKKMEIFDLLEKSTIDNVARDGDDDAEKEPKEYGIDTMLLDGRERQMGFDGGPSSSTDRRMIGHPRKMISSDLVKDGTLGIFVGDGDDGAEEEPREDGNDTMPLDGRKILKGSETWHPTSQTTRGQARKTTEMVSSSLLQESIMDIVAKDDNNGVGEELGDQGQIMQLRDTGRFNFAEDGTMIDDAKDKLGVDDGRERHGSSKSKHGLRIDQGQIKQLRDTGRFNFAEHGTMIDDAKDKLGVDDSATTPLVDKLRQPTTMVNSSLTQESSMDTGEEGGNDFEEEDVGEDGKFTTSHYGRERQKGFESRHSTRVNVGQSRQHAGEMVVPNFGEESFGDNDPGDEYDGVVEEPRDGGSVVMPRKGKEIQKGSASRPSSSGTNIRRTGKSRETRGSNFAKESAIDHGAYDGAEEELDEDEYTSTTTPPIEKERKNGSKYELPSSTREMERSNLDEEITIDNCAKDEDCGAAEEPVEDSIRREEV